MKFIGERVGDMTGLVCVIAWFLPLVNRMESLMPAFFLDAGGGGRSKIGADLSPGESPGGGTEGESMAGTAWDEWARKDSDVNQR